MARPGPEVVDRQDHRLRCEDRDDVEGLIQVRGRVSLLRVAESIGVDATITERSPQSKAGGFTQLFGNSPNAGTSVDPLAPAAPAKSAPGSFTQMLNASAPSAQAQSRIAPPQQPAAHSAAQPTRSNYDVLAGGGSGATTVFGSGAAPAPAAMPSGPSQFTQVLSGSEMRKLAMQAQQQPMNPVAMPPGAGMPMPSVQPMAMPQMPQMMYPAIMPTPQPMPPQAMPPQMQPMQMPQMAMPPQMQPMQMPQMAMPQMQPMQMPPMQFAPPQMQMQPLQVPMPPKPAGFAQYAPLIAILCVIGFVAILLVLLFAIRH